MGHRVALGERRRLPLGRPARRLHLTAQPLVDLQEPFALDPQALVLHAQPFAFGRQPFALGLQPPLLLAQRGVLLLQPGDPPARPGRASPDPDRSAHLWPPPPCGPKATTDASSVKDPLSLPPAVARTPGARTRPPPWRPPCAYAEGKVSSTVWSMPVEEPG